MIWRSIVLAVALLSSPAHADSLRVAGAAGTIRILPGYTPADCESAVRAFADTCARQRPVVSREFGACFVPGSDEPIAKLECSP